MPMAAQGVAKLIEECGELTQILGKKLAYWSTDEHPDGSGSISARLCDEIADVMAACLFVVNTLELDDDYIDSRCGRKLAQFIAWHHQPDNNEHSIETAREVGL